jgi:hypothetical protein
VVNEVFGNQANTFLNSHYGFERCPFGLEFFLLLQFFAFGDLIELGIDLRLFFFVQFQFGEASAIGLISAVTIVLLTALLNRLLKLDTVEKGGADV